jgi:sigma-B regulation protein RsbQ
MFGVLGGSTGRPFVQYQETSMSVALRNNVKVQGQGEVTLVFAHGFGCDQHMWRKLAPDYSGRYRCVTFDLVGSGTSDIAAYDPEKYSSLYGYAGDLLEVVEEFGRGPVVFVGHSVSAMIGVLASIKNPGAFAGHIMVGPSPCYINDADYVGGFTREDIDSLLETLESNYLGWASSMAPAIMGSPEQPELAEELTNSFCRTDPEIAKQFARVTFMTDNRADLPKVSAPVLIIQSTEDLIAPLAVGEYLHKNLPNSMLRVLHNVGHCPQLSAPSASSEAMDEFLASINL